MRRALPWLALAALCAVAAFTRWRLAEHADWGIDEAANLWMGGKILDDGVVRVGLTSSRGIANFAGVPLLAAPLARLPDLLAVSRVLSLLQLAALIGLALALVRERGRLTAAAALAFCPAMVLASPSLWNQYVALPVTALVTAVLVMLVDRPEANPRATGADAAILLLALLLLQPEVHLAGFADLAAQGGIALVLLGLRARRGRQVGIQVGVAIAFLGAYALYEPWLLLLTHWGRPAVLAAYLAAATAVVALTRAVEGRLTAHVRRAGALPWLAWSVPLVLAACIACSALAFYGAGIGVRLLLGDPWGTALLAAQVLLAAMALPALPSIVADCRAGHSARALLEGWFGARAPAAAVLIANAGLLLIGRALLAPEAFTSNGRPDLLLPLLPALLAPALLLAVSNAQPVLRAWAALGAAGATAVVVGVAIVGPGARYWEAFPLFLPASEMRGVVDWLAEQPGAIDAEGKLDVGYDLGREKLVAIACSPGTSWYTASRPFDWLFLRRHGLRNQREGSCTRGPAGHWLVTYRGAPPPPDRRLRLTTNHLAVWE